MFDFSVTSEMTSLLKRCCFNASLVFKDDLKKLTQLKIVYPLEKIGIDNPELLNEELEFLGLLTVRSEVSFRLWFDQDFYFSGPIFQQDNSIFNTNFRKL